MLLAWFELNRENPEARQYYYKEIPEYYVYNKTTGKWTERQKGEVISRMHMINPRNKELFHLRILLLHVRGATSFDFLKTVNDITYKTFTEAAIALNLVDNDTQWYEFMEEIIHNEIAFMARYSFIMMLIHCMPANPNALQLWTEYSIRLSRDLIGTSKSQYIGVQQALQHIEDMCKAAGSSMKTVGLPKPDRDVARYDNSLFNIGENKTPEEYLLDGEALKTQLNELQLEAYNAIHDSALRRSDRRAKCFFISGMGGSGKTFLIRVIIFNLNHHYIFLINYFVLVFN